MKENFVKVSIIKDEETRETTTAYVNLCSIAYIEEKSGVFLVALNNSRRI